MGEGALPKTTEHTPPVSSEVVESPETPSSAATTKPTPVILRATSKILDHKRDHELSCDAEDCPITNKHILFGMHCVYYKDKTYHPLCAKTLPQPLTFEIEQPPLRPKEASNK